MKTIYILIGWFAEGREIFGVFLKPSRARSEAERATPHTHAWASSVLWKNEHGDDWSGTIAAPFRLEGHEREIVSWSVVPRNLDELWV